VNVKDSFVAGAGGVSEVRQVAAELLARLRDPDRARPDGLLGQLDDLHRTNLAQWGFEDATRSADASDAVIASAKREIDALNGRRHQLVEAIDAAIDASVAQVSSATPSTESPGMVYDRLSVLVIRLHHTEVAAGAAGPDAERYAARLPALRDQLATLEAALAALLDEVRAGTKRFAPYQSLKLYGPTRPSRR
jgi:Protein of unknown function (DUF4254)